MSHKSDVKFVDYHIRKEKRVERKRRESAKRALLRMTNRKNATTNSIFRCFTCI